MPIEWDLYRRIVIKNLGETATKDEIADLFSRAGRIVGDKFFVSRNPAGFAFIQYEHRRDAKIAAKTLDGKRCCGQIVKVELTVKSLDCSICFRYTLRKEPKVAGCGHVFCAKCITNRLKKCPKCNKKISIKGLKKVFS